MDPLQCALTWDKNNHNGTQGNNKITTTTKKDERTRVSMLYQQGNCKYGPKVTIKFTKLTMKPTKRLYLMVKSSLIYYFFSCFIFLFSSNYTSADFFCFLWRISLTLLFILLRDEEEMIYFHLAFILGCKFWWWLRAIILA